MGLVIEGLLRRIRMFSTCYVTFMFVLNGRENSYFGKALSIGVCLILMRFEIDKNERLRKLIKSQSNFEIPWNFQ